MGHWRSLLDSEVLRFVDLQRDYAVQIATVKKGKVKGAGGKESGKALLTFTGWPKPAAFGTAQLTTIAGLYGNDVKDWQGKWITIYPDPTVKFGGANVGGIRVRPVAPKEEDRVLPKIGDAKAGAA